MPIPPSGNSHISHSHDSIPEPLVIAHRGASWEEPENTLRAFRRAIELSADYVELDVRATHDGVLVATHAPVRVRFRELRDRNPNVPTLAEVLRNASTRSASRSRSSATTRSSGHSRCCANRSRRGSDPRGLLLTERNPVDEAPQAWAADYSASRAGIHARGVRLRVGRGAR